MPDLFSLLTPLKRVGHPLLTGRRITLIGVSAVLRDEDAYYFEVNRPRYWTRQPDGSFSIGIGGIGGRIEPGEMPLTCLRREIREEIGTRFRLEVAPHTALIHEWQLAAWIELPTNPKHPAPYFINLLPPRLGGSGTPDFVAIVTFLGRPQARPSRRDLFGLLTVARSALPHFLARDKWPLEEALAHPHLTFDLADDLPAGSTLRPVLTARALQAVVRQGVIP